jgi:serine/threonine-protein kinase RsbW
VGVPISENKKVFRAKFDSLAEIATFIHPYCQNARLDNSSCYHVETAVDEACSNIIEHAYEGENKGDIEVCCQVNPKDITITLTDYGKSFNPEEIPEPNRDAPLEERDSHGLGLYFIRKLMDKVVFTHGNDCSNVLVLIKYLK